MFILSFHSIIDFMQSGGLAERGIVVGKKTMDTGLAPANWEWDIARPKAHGDASLAQKFIRLALKLMKRSDFDTQFAMSLFLNKR